MEPYHIILADDHVLIRSGLKRTISERPDLRVLGEASDGLELLNLLNDVSPDMIILDISMPRLRGIEAIHEIKLRQPNVKILMLTMHRDVQMLHLAVEAGADGYLLKEDAEVELFSAIETIQQGRMYVSPFLQAEVTNAWVQTCRGKSESFGSTVTPREREILKLIGEGKSKREIADLLSISIHTVEFHRANIINKLNLKTTTDLVKYAIQNGYT
jgi:DNA-binding NarL/FixJ family response regulator